MQRKRIVLYYYVVVVSLLLPFLLSQTFVGGIQAAKGSSLQTKDLFFLEQEDSGSLPSVSGEVVIVRLSRKVGSNYRVVLSSKGKKIISVPTMVIDNKQFAMLGIKHSFKDGTYTISLEADGTETDGYVYSGRKIISIRQRAFLEEEIKLNRTLSKRRKAKPSQKVIAQAKKLWDITREFNEEDLYSYDLFKMPVQNYERFSGMYSDSRKFLGQEGTVIDSSFHGGVDIVADIGTEVRAPSRGKVVFAGAREVTGKTIAIVHFPGMYSLYYHLNGIQVELDQVVEGEELIGEVGNSGFSTGPHLHWELRVHNVRVDPLLSIEALDKVFILDIE